jgi:valyl-tRNA synthetase
VQFYWHEFCDYYIEDVKHRIYSEEESMHGSKKAAAYTLKTVLDATLRMLAPIAPHICEEINSRFSAKSIFTEEFPKYAEKPEGPSFVLNGVVFSSDIVEVDYSSAGVLLNDIIADVRKQKAAQRLALNKEITSININVPEEYYKAVEIGRSDLKSICKASEVKLSKAAEYSVSIEV